MCWRLLGMCFLCVSSAHLLPCVTWVSVTLVVHIHVSALYKSSLSPTLGNTLILKCLHCVMAAILHLTVYSILYGAVLYRMRHVVSRAYKHYFLILRKIRYFVTSCLFEEPTTSCRSGLRKIL